MEVEHPDPARPSDLARRRVERVADDDRPSIEVVEEELELVRPIGRVERRYCGDRGEGQECAGSLGPVLDKQRHTVPCVDPAGTEIARDARDERPKTVVRKSLSRRRQQSGRVGYRSLMVERIVHRCQFRPRHLQELCGRLAKRSKARTTIASVRAIVTGGAGFIGSHVVDALLARGDEVTVVDDLSTGRREYLDPRARLVEHDIREPFDIDADVVFHLAAQADVGTSVERPIFDAEVNVLGTLNVLEAARGTGAAVVFTSTGGAIYGDVERPATEDAPLRPVSPYGMAKLAAEGYVAGWSRTHALETTVLRLANVYGPRQSAALEGGVVAIFLERMADGRETTIFGDGEQSRDFVYVEDVVRALLAAAARGKGIFNVGTGVETTVNRLHELCRMVAGAEDEPEHGPPRTGDARRSVLDASYAAQELGWRAETSLEDGLRMTWEWLGAV